jgi:hypothetical protein
MKSFTEHLVLFCNTIKKRCRSQWPRGLRHEPSSPAQTLGSWVRIPLEAWISVCVYSVFVLSLRADPPSKESYRLCKRLRNWKSGQGPTNGCFMLVSCLAYPSTLKMEATFSSETSVAFQGTTQRYILEDTTLHDHCCENLSSYIHKLTCRVCYLGESPSYTFSL